MSRKSGPSRVFWDAFRTWMRQVRCINTRRVSIEGTVSRAEMKTTWEMESSVQEECIQAQWQCHSSGIVGVKAARSSSYFRPHHHIKPAECTSSGM
ncbi:hypothetical protein AVEN_16432-1 [Araneus ventricosus]|uniref:Uncharacterized protein n=1 Tax=Araneus ventricosus TaxID=182803 RepID=A0A4Y2HSX9_ARAVE|nr:hypothetical protein AVEN_16432-1 [Araneus ventricosus]